AGAAGIGKTRLASELQHYAQRKGALALTGTCLSREGIVPYLSFVEAIGQYFEATRAPGSEGKREEVKRFIQEEAPELMEIVQRFGTSIGFDKERIPLPSPNVSSQTAKARLFEALSQLLILISTGRSLVLLIDDLQWADSASLELLHYVARSTANHRLMIMATYRPEDLIPSGEEKVHPLVDTMQRMSREGLFGKVTLEGLSSRDLSRMIESLFRRTAFSDDFLRSLYQETEGNPFFILEVLKLLRDEEVLFESDGVWYTQREITKEDIPERIYDVIVRRIERLEDDQRELLELAAVEGERFTSAVLAHVLDLPRMQVLKTIQRLERGYQIIQSEGDRYAFNHTKIREILYAEIPAELRKVYHLAVGEYLEEAHRENPGAILGQLADHFHGGEDFDRAFPYLVQAGDHASRLFASKESCRYYEQALDFLGKADRIADKRTPRRELLQKLGSSYEILGDLDRALASYQDCAQLSEELDDLESKAGSLRRIGRISSRRNDWEAAMRYLKTSQTQYEEMGDEQGIAQVLTDIGTVFAEKGEYESAEEHFQRALTVAHRADFDELMATLYTNLGILHNIKGESDEANSYCRKSMALYERMGDLQGLARVYHNLAMIYSDQKDWSHSEQFFKSSLELSKKIRDRGLTALIHLNRAEVYLNRLEPKEAKECCVRALETFRKLGDRLGTADALKMLGIASKLYGDWESAECYFKDSISLNEELGSPLGLAEAYGEYGAMLKDQAQLDRALLAFEESRSLFEQIGSTENLKRTAEVILQIQELERENACVAV
ncbi:MAG: tetratricopeptide repeat protein, partial [Candidatus Latescibacterota bacterium]